MPTRTRTGVTDFADQGLSISAISTRPRADGCHRATVWTWACARGSKISRPRHVVRSGAPLQHGFPSGLVQTMGGLDWNRTSDNRIALRPWRRRGSWIRTSGLRLMRTASYQAALPRYAAWKESSRRWSCHCPVGRKCSFGLVTQACPSNLIRVCAAAESCKGINCAPPQIRTETHDVRGRCSAIEQVELCWRSCYQLCGKEWEREGTILLTYRRPSLGSGPYGSLPWCWEGF